MDRYLAACYPDEVCALDYLSPDTLIAVSDGMRVLERSKNYHWELSEDVKPSSKRRFVRRICRARAESGGIEPSHGRVPRAAARFAPHVAQSAAAEGHPQHERAIAASYGGSLETAAGDMERYLGAGCGVLVLCGNETRAKNFRRLLEERNIRAQLNLKNDRSPPRTRPSSASAR